jgi:hypothetical protein
MADIKSAFFGGNLGILENEYYSQDSHLPTESVNFLIFSIYRTIKNHNPKNLYLSRYSGNCLNIVGLNI